MPILSLNMLGYIDCILTGHGIYNENRLIDVHMSL